MKQFKQENKNVETAKTPETVEDAVVYFHKNNYETVIKFLRNNEDKLLQKKTTR